MHNHSIPHLVENMALIERRLIYNRPMDTEQGFAAMFQKGLMEHKMTVMRKAIILNRLIRWPESPLKACLNYLNILNGINFELIYSRRKMRQVIVSVVLMFLWS